MKKFLPLLALILIAIGSWWAYTRYVKVEALPDGLVQANGRIEGDLISVSSKYPGRIARITVEEGDSVVAGDVLVELEAREIEAKVRQAEQAAEAVRHQVEAASSQCEQTERDAQRYAELYAEGTATQREAEQAELADEVAQEKRIAAEAQLEQARAAYDEACVARDELTLSAPSDGVVTNRLHEPGVVIAAGSPVLTLVDMDKLHLKVYVPENLIGQLRLGLPAKIYSDAFPDDPYDATVSYISSRAEFTPKEVQTPDERVKLVYAVKLALTENPDHRLTPGIPADAVIRWDESIAWEKPRW